MSWNKAFVTEIWAQKHCIPHTDTHLMPQHWLPLDRRPLPPLLGHAEFLSALQRQVSITSSKHRRLHKHQRWGPVASISFQPWGLVKRLQLLKIDSLYVRTLYVRGAQRLLCPAEKDSCFCFSSSPSLPLQQLSVSYLSTTKPHTNTLRQTLTHNEINATALVPSNQSSAVHRHTANLGSVLTKSKPAFCLFMQPFRCLLLHTRLSFTLF